ncbi:uncharacterized protein LOC125126183 isoform X2 [Phacochoerus africanus]|uniref:uncharacterized protein LOC125126183 isoform X2 n=1 Tax=Phacochoerus africanus TaxID=41426 RepID=UPI001FD8D41F|nr:uncharacterized protein LOC125126183 isoform X2 [Phacochoerus africanus]
MGLCARSARQVLPEAQPTEEKTVVPPGVSRVNGWSKPLHKFQVVCWVVFFALTFTNFGIFIPLLPPYWRYTAYGVTGSIFLFHLVVHIVAVSINPAEKSVRQKNYLEPMPVFDRSKHAHVIQDLYCLLCEINVDSKTKHCSACNKCVSGFDHHCKWLNNCVGRKNYRYFFSSVVSALAGLLCMFAILSYLFVQFLVDPMQLRTDPHFAGLSRDTWLLFLPFLPVRAKAPVLLLIGLLVLVLVIVGLVLLGHLFFFHLYLMMKKLSTYEYITQSRQQLQSNASPGRRVSDPQKRPSRDAGRRRSSVQREKPAGLLSPSQESGSLSGVAPEAVAVPKGPVVILMPPLQSLTSTDLTSPAPSLDLTLSAPCPDGASTVTLLPGSISSAPCPDGASTVTLLPGSILSAPCPDGASTVTLLPGSISSAPCPDGASTVTLLPGSISSAPCPDGASTVTLLPGSIASAPCPDGASTVTLLPGSISSAPCPDGASTVTLLPGSISSAPCLDGASTVTLLPESIASAPCPDGASTITLLPESIASAPCLDRASTITLLPESILSLQELASSQKPRFLGSVRRREFLLPAIRESLSSLSTITSEGSASLKRSLASSLESCRRWRHTRAAQNPLIAVLGWGRRLVTILCVTGFFNDSDEGDLVQIIRQPEIEDVDNTEGSVSGAQGPALAQPPDRGLFAAIPPVEDPLESLPLQGALQVGGQDVWSVRTQRVRPAPTDSWMLESTVLTIPGQVELDPAEELPRRLQRDSLRPQPAHQVAPGAVPLSSWGAKGLPAFKGGNRVKVTPIASVGHSQSAEDIPQSDTTEATVIMMPEGSELPDGAPKST